MKNNISALLSLVIAILLLFIFVQNSCTREETAKEPRPQYISIPSKIEIPEIPDITFEPFTEVIKEKEYIYVPVPTEPDTTLLNAYKRTVDSLERELMYTDAVTKRSYKSIYEDNNLIAHFYVETTGTLNKLQMPYYKLKEKDIIVIPDVPDINTPKFDLLLGVELGVPTTLDQNFIFKGNVFIQNRNMMYSGSFDTDRRVWAGLNIKL